MKTKYTISKLKKWITIIVILAIGVGLGKLFFGSETKTNGSTKATTEAIGKPKNMPQVWTCAMHPQVRETHPGKCPICAMDLIPLQQNADKKTMAGKDTLIRMTDEAIALANIETTEVAYSPVQKEIRLYGTVKADERLTQTQTAHVNGRIEQLYIDYTGQTVRRGQTIATVYSPDLLNAQQELLEAKKWADTQPEILAAAREKLSLLKVTPSQIKAIEQSGKTSPLITIKATTDGIVIAKNIHTGDYISQGEALFSIADLTRVWVLFDAYETDLSYIHQDNPITFTSEAIPGHEFKGKVSFIDRILDPQTRTAKVRVEIANPALELKPEMYASAIIEAGNKASQKALIIPKSAVLWTGKRSVVYVKTPMQKASFEMRTITLGNDLGHSYVVVSGLNAGEQVVTNGAFAIDASAQLDGKPSMMNRAGTKKQRSSMPGMDMSGMDMSGMDMNN